MTAAFSVFGTEETEAVPLCIEDYGVTVAPSDTDQALAEKQKGKKPRGSEGEHDNPSRDGMILIKRPRLEGCPNPVEWIEKEVENSSISNPLSSGSSVRVPMAA